METMFSAIRSRVGADRTTVLSERSMSRMLANVGAGSWPTCTLLAGRYSGYGEDDPGSSARHLVSYDFEVGRESTDEPRLLRCLRTSWIKSHTSEQPSRS